MSHTLPPFPLSRFLLDVPFLYFAYGPTGVWGNAQRNAALAVVRALGRQYGMVGPGYFMDDDSYVSPWLFDAMFQVSGCPGEGRGGFARPGGCCL